MPVPRVERERLFFNLSAARAAETTSYKRMWILQIRIYEKFPNGSTRLAL